MADFVSQQGALEVYLGQDWEVLPNELRARVQRDNPILANVWNQIGPERRRECARQSDMQHNPSIWRQNARAWRLANEMIELEGTATPTAGDWMAKKAGLADLRRASDENDAEAERILVDEQSRANKEQYRDRLFNEPFWPAGRVLNWIAFGHPRAIEASWKAARRYRYTRAPGQFPMREGRPEDVLLRAVQTGAILAIAKGQELKPEDWATANGYDWPSDVRFRRADVLRLWPSELDPAPAKIEQEAIANALAWTRPATNAGTANAAPDPYITLDDAIRSLMPIEYQDGSFCNSWEEKNEAARATLKDQLLRDIDEAKARLIPAHVDGRCNLIGRKTAFNSNEPLRDHERIPNELFARATLANGNFLHPREQLDVHGAHPVYWADVKMLLSEFGQVFKPMKIVQDFRKWLAEFLAREGEAATEKQAVSEFVRRRGWKTTVFRQLWSDRPREFKRDPGKRLKPIRGAMHKTSEGNPQAGTFSDNKK